MDMSNKQHGLSYFDAFIKRTFDILLSGFGLIITWWLILIAALLARFDTGLNGFFTQTRIGRYGKLFKVIKRYNKYILKNILTE